MLNTVHHFIQVIIKNIFSVLDDGPTDDVNGSINAAGKNFRINFNETRSKFCLNFHNICA